MKRIILIVLAILAITTISKADGFINTQQEMFFGRTYTIQYTDEVPTESLQYYFAYSLDNGMNWTRFSDTLIWACPDTAVAQLTVMRIGDVKIGIFTNPNGEWRPAPYTFDSKFLYSEDFEFIQQPDTIYNGGSYDFSLRVNPDEAPPELLLQFTTNNGDSWMTWETITINPGQSIKDITIDNGMIKETTIWRLCYINPLKIVCTSYPIPYKERDTYFHFKTKGGQKEIGDKVTLMWEKSYNFDMIEITTTFDNEVIDVTDYYTDGIEVNFAKNGEYTITGIAKDAHYVITNTIVFTVGDPCSLVKAQAVIYRDSIQVLNVKLANKEKIIQWADSTILALNLSNAEKDSLLALANRELDQFKLELVKLQEYIVILKSDSLTLQLIYKDGDVLEVKDTKFNSELTTVYAELTGSNQIYLIVPKDYRNKELTWWCFDYQGKFVEAGFNTFAPLDIMIGNNITKGVYIWYVLVDGKYVAYKFVI